MENSIVIIQARDIPDAWFQCLTKILDQNKFKVQHGSFIGETRLQFDFIVISIKFPYCENYDLMLPEIPPVLGIPNPVDKGYVEQYLPYLMTGDIKPNETYTYGQRINAFPFNNKIISQVEHFIEVLKKTPNTNQAILQIASPSDCEISDPPCLRHIGIQIRDKKLIFYPYFRCIDSNTEMIYKHNNNVYLGTLLDIHNLVSSGNNVYIINTNLKNYKVKWELVEESSIRKANNIRRFHFKNNLDFGMTDEHIVFTPEFKEVNAKKLVKNDYLIKINNITSLHYRKSNRIFFPDFFKNTKFEKYIYLYNWKITDFENISGKLSHQSFVDLFKNRNRIPLTLINKTKSIPKHITIGINDRNNKIDQWLDLDEDFGYFVGVFLANGKIEKNNNDIVLSRLSRMRKFRIEKKLKKFEIKYTNVSKFSIKINNRFIVLLLNVLIKGNKKEIGPNIINTNKKFHEYILKSFSDSNVLYTSNRCLISGLEFLGKLCGYKTSVYSRPEKKVKNYNEISLQLKINKNKNKKDIQKTQIKKIDDYYSNSVIDLKINGEHPNFAIGSELIIVHNSWDLWSGFPANLAAIAVMQKYMADEIGIDNGKMISASHGLHIYGYAEELVRIRCHRNQRQQPHS